MIMNVSKCLMAMAAVLLLLSCASSLSCRMDDFVAEAESSCKEWTAEDWELSTEKYEKLLEEYSQNTHRITIPIRRKKKTLSTRLSEDITG